MEDILENLRHNRPLSGLPEVEGRTFIKGVRLRTPKPKQTVKISDQVLETRESTYVVKEGEWRYLHFLKSDLSGAEFVGSEISDSVFEACKLRDLQLSTSRIVRCKFMGCDLRGAGMGDMAPASKTNHFVNVLFDQCDLRKSGHFHERYENCTFQNCTFGGSDFMGAIFESCIFRGKVEDVNFRARDPYLPGESVNHFRHCDFREADVSMAGFLNIDLDPHMFTLGDDLLVLKHGPKDWRDWGQLLTGDRMESRRAFAEERANRSGTPSIVSRKYLRQVFSEDLISALDTIAGAL